MSTGVLFLINIKEKYLQTLCSFWLFPAKRERHKTTLSSYRSCQKKVLLETLELSRLSPLFFCIFFEGGCIVHEGTFSQYGGGRLNEKFLPSNALSLINSLTTAFSFVKISSKHLCFQTVRARDLTLWDNVHHPLCVTCHMSGVRCQITGVRRHTDKVVELVGGGSVINWATLSSLSWIGLGTRVPLFY